MSSGVAMVASVFHPSVGGIQTHTLRLSQKLRARGLEVAVLTRSGAGLARYEELDGLPVHRLGVHALGKAAEAVTYIADALRWLGMNRSRYGIVHAHQMLSPMSIGLGARRALGLHLVVNPHLGGPGGDVHLLRYERPLGQARLREAKRSADAFVAISAQIRQELVDLGVPSEQIWDIANGVDTEHFRPLAAAERASLRTQLGFPDGPWAVFTGRLVPQKGLDVLLNAWPGVRQRLPKARLLVVGEGESRKELEALAAKLGVSDAVHWLGAATDVVRYLQAADAYVLPSRGEGLPVALLEAMACGLPVVATAVGGTPELLPDGEAGLLVPPEDPARLAEALVRALSAPQAGSWGRVARERIAQRHGLDAVADRYVALYASLPN